MIHLLSDLGFILRNWRYFHAHQALWVELRDWLIDYDRPHQPQQHVDYSINTTGLVGADPHLTASLIALRNRPSSVSGLSGQVPTEEPR